MMNKIIYYIKQFFPFTYWTKYKNPDNNKCYVAIWKQWFGKSFSKLHFEVNNIQNELIDLSLLSVNGKECLNDVFKKAEQRYHYMKNN